MAQSPHPKPLSGSQRRLRIAMVAACPFPANHGTPAAIRELSVHLADQGHEVHVITYPQSEPIPVPGLRIHRVRPPLFRPGAIRVGPSLERLIYDALMIPKLVSVIRKHDLQVIHAHNYEANLVGILAKWLTRRPLVYNAVTSMASELPTYRFIRPDRLARWFGRFLDLWVPRPSDLILALSDELKDYLLTLGNPRDRLLVVPPGVEMEWLAAGCGTRARERLGVPAGVPIIVYTGALERFQGIDRLLEAMAILCRSNPSAKLVLASNVRTPEAMDGYRMQSQALGIAERVIFVDYLALDELPDLLAAADVAVVPRGECPGYPIKLLNYMAAACPIVSFAGSAKSVCHGYSGYVVADGDVADFAAGIRYLLDHPDEARLLGAQAQGSLRGIFDWPTLAGGVAAAYEQLAANSAAFRPAMLAHWIKGSYQPRLENSRQITEFVKSGTLVYPELAAIEPQVARHS